MLSLESALRKVDRSVKKWFNKVRPYEGGRYKAPLCPICGEVCKYDTDFMEHIQMEEHIRCPNHHYYYEFVTGGTRVLVGSVEICKHYSDSNEERQYKSRMINLALIHERTKWMKEQT